MPRGAEDRRRGGVTAAAAVRADYLGCLCGAFSTRRRGESFFGVPACQPFFPAKFAKLPHFFWKDIEIYGNTLTSCNYLRFPPTPAKFAENFGETYAI